MLVPPLKVDRSFIDGAPWNPELATISRAIIGLGNSLGLQVIAEGVGKNEHVEFLQREHCILAQGYLFSRPRPANELQWLLDGDELLQEYRRPQVPLPNFIKEA